MKTVRFSETLASTNLSTRRVNPEEHHHYHHRRENFKSHITSKYILSQLINRKFAAEKLKIFQW
jgi:hypothetical protein